MDYIIAFNKKVQELMAGNPNDETLRLIQQYKDKKRYRDYYLTIDSLSYNVGIGIGTQMIVDNKDKIIGWEAVFKYGITNALNHKPGVFPIVEGHFKTLDKCYAYLAREFVYLLMRINNLEQYV